MDLFRLSDPTELWELGWQELGAHDELVLVEWPERAETMLPASRWEVSLRVVEEDDGMRAVAVNRFGVPPHLPGFPVTV
jgi:tRNA threonylcarbamoyladenosine biosynthesis protein TsaE